MARASLSTGEMLTLLAATPPRLAELATGLTPVQLRTAPAPGEWSAVEVLAHLRARADVWGECISRMRTEESPTLRAINPRARVTETDYPGMEYAPSLEALTRQRDDLLAVLHALTPDDWERSATVTGVGRPFVRSVTDYVRRMSTHERGHLKQLARSVAAVQAS